MTGEKVPVPCGKCYECLQRRASQWSFRMLKESERSKTGLFVTLTYDTRFVPITEKGFMSLDKTHIQLFMKRLRKREPLKLKYYCAGEYGGKSYRPHYHLILFNCLDIENLHKSWIDPETGSSLGGIHVGSASGASAAYTCKYINKQAQIPMHKNDDRIPEFSTMSKGLGSNYLDEKTVKWHKSDLKRAYIVLEGGNRISLPRYYKDKIYTDTERTIQNYEVSKIMSEKQQKAEKEHYQNPSSNKKLYEDAKIHTAIAKKEKMINYSKSKRK